MAGAFCITTMVTEHLRGGRKRRAWRLLAGRQAQCGLIMTTMAGSIYLSVVLLILTSQRTNFAATKRRVKGSIVSRGYTRRQRAGCFTITGTARLRTSARSRGLRRPWERPGEL